MKLKPYTLIERPPCSVYGFSLSLPNFMFDSGDNHCALKQSSTHLCEMERKLEKPDWSKCSLYNTEENKKIIKVWVESEMSVFPREFRPAKTKNWGRMSLRDWIAYIENLHKE